MAAFVGLPRVTDMSDPWGIERLDLAAYLDRIGFTGDAGTPDRTLLAALHEAHLRAFTFDNIDVLLEQHPGIDLETVQEKFVGRGRGGYCFEHATLFSAVLERLGFDVRRRLGRVDNGTGITTGRTHMTIEVRFDDGVVLADPGFGMSPLHPVDLVDGAETDTGGWRYRAVRLPEVPAWEVHRFRDGGWELMHTTDALPVHPADVAMGHHFTSTFPTSHFRHGLMVTRFLDGRHVTVTHQTVTIRRPGEPTEHRPLLGGELDGWLDDLGVPLTDDERSRLRAWTQAATRAPS